MPRKKMASAPDATKAIVTSADPIKAGNRSRLAMKRAGFENIKQSIKLYDIEERFANVYVAVGFAGSIAAQPFTQRQIHEFEAIGKARLSSLGIVETSDNIGDRTEVVVSLPLTQQDSLNMLYALGLKRTGLSTSRSFVELRGATVIDTLRPLVAEMGGVFTIVERPATVLPEPQKTTATSAADAHSDDKLKANSTTFDADAQEVYSESPISAAIITETSGTTNETALPTDHTAEQLAVTSATDLTSNIIQNDSGLPPYLRHNRTGQVSGLPPVASSPPAQPSPMAEVIKQVLRAPTKSIRPQFRPPVSATPRM